MKKRRCEREERERRRERRRGDDFRHTFLLILDHVGLGEDLELVLCHGVHWVGHVRGGGGLGRGGGGLFMSNHHKMIKAKRFKIVVFFQLKKFNCWQSRPSFVQVA